MLQLATLGYVLYYATFGDVELGLEYATIGDVGVYVTNATIGDVRVRKFYNWRR